MLLKGLYRWIKSKQLLKLYLPERCVINKEVRLSQFSKLSHTIYECKYHIVFCPKYRYRILKGNIGEYCKRELYFLCRHKDKVEILELNVLEDHIHIVLSVPPKYAISSLMGYLKGNISTKMFHKFERLGKQYWGRHFWSRGYCVSTIGLNEDQIRKYVKWQEKNDKLEEQQNLEL